MSWETLNQREEQLTRKPASVRFTARLDSDRPSCVVSIRRDLAHAADWKASDAVGLQVGSGDHEGKLRLLRLRDGASNVIARVRMLHKGGFTVDLGYVPQFGREPHTSRSAVARLIDVDTIEVDLPDWTDGDADGEAPDGDELEDVDDRAAPPPTPQPRPTAPIRQPQQAKVNAKADPPLTRNGVTIRFEEDNESIHHGGKTMDITARQAQLLAVLLRGSPSPIDLTFVKKQIWGTPTPAADLALGQIITDLTKVLPGIGLVLKNAKGIGLALQVKE